ncbi:glycoside hydrolase family 3 protein [Nitritalea halalkaliphila]|uniref:glycoside hydrolase family 3 protein n=1 Tax=Nitritalea halalkaliphila TaxID=590849 RepID=UPI0002DA5AFC|nr:glycoside hydrolase family 3 N-terminal domain-containing protein [Nitritalea halalkaliphila]
MALGAQTKDPLLTRDYAEQMAWVEAQFQAMSLEERIGQLFMVAAYSNKGAAHEAAIARLVEQEGVGGLIFFQGGPGRQASLTNRYQGLAKVPLFLAMDAEWGMQMRLDSLPAFPRAMTLGAQTSPELIRTMGNEIGRQFREIGMHINFAPVVDVNANPRNPVIGNRSFGEDPVRVGQLASAYMKGLQEQKVLANAKHFPGHGDTESDSHHTLPVIRNSRAHLEEVDLVPFRMLFQEGLTSVMVAHLHIPALDATPNLATTLSPKVVQGLLQEEMGFQGLAFTDALNMKGVSNFNKPGEVDLKALLAGNDVLLFAEDVPKAKRLIIEALRKGELEERVLNAKVVKILKAKYWAGLHRQGPVFTAGLAERLHTPATDALLKELYAASLTVLDNEDGFLPMKFLDLNRVATLTIGGDASVFQEKFDRYAEAKHFSIGKGETNRALRDKLAEFDVVVVNLMGVSGGAGSNYGLNRMDMIWLKDLAKVKTVVPVLYGSPYALAALSGLGNVVVAYENNRYVQDVVPELLFGARGTQARLPVTASFSWRVGSGEDVLPSGDWALLRLFSRA